MSLTREAYICVVQHGDHDDQETELVTLEGLTAAPGATIELTDGTRITLVEPAGQVAAQKFGRVAA
jgi:hypothetical protein